MQIVTKTNKVIYTTASVTYGWVGALIQARSLFGLILHMTDQRTDRPTELLIEACM